jgi:acetolactate synthase regulatory subunit
MPTTKLNIRVQPGNDVLHRVISVCHRRGLEIVALNYVEGLITITFVGRPGHTGRIDRWLAGLVDVLAVEAGRPDERAARDYGLR